MQKLKSIAYNYKSFIHMTSQENRLVPFIAVDPFINEEFRLVNLKHIVSISCNERAVLRLDTDSGKSYYMGAFTDKLRCRSAAEELIYKWKSLHSMQSQHLNSCFLEH